MLFRSGGSGADTYLVDALTDTIFEQAFNGTDTVQTSVNWTLASDFENILIISTGKVSATGNSVANVMTGGSGYNAMSGLGGNDTITGMGGNDTLTGGGGVDQFVFVSAASGKDTIADFNALDGGQDENDTLVFTGLLTGTFAYLGTGLFTGGSDDSEARVSGNTLQIDTDGNGVVNITIIMTGLVTASQLSTSDFVWN